MKTLAKYLGFLVVLLTMFMAWDTNAQTVGFTTPTGATYKLQLQFVYDAAGDTQSRIYYLHVPTTCVSSMCPLMVVLHGAGGTGGGMDQGQLVGMENITRFDTYADQYNFLVAYPDSSPNDPNKGWNDNFTQPGNDVTFTYDLIEDIQNSYSVDARHIYVTGYSEGANLAMVDTFCNSTEFAGIGNIDVNLNPSMTAPTTPCPTLATPVPYVEFHGVGDPIVFYDGGLEDNGNYKGSSIYSAAVTAEDWAGYDGCLPKSAPQSTTTTIQDILSVGPTSTKAVTDVATIWGQCAGGTTVSFYTISDGGHTWPGGSQEGAPIPVWPPGEEEGASGGPAATVNGEPAPCFDSPGTNPSEGACLGATSQKVNATLILWQTLGRYENPNPIAGACGNANGTNATSPPISLTSLCTVGTASAVTGTDKWRWTCAGYNGGTTASCSAFLLVNGVCGRSNGKSLQDATPGNLCDSGKSSTVSETPLGDLTWSCSGSRGGVNASCSATQVINAACGTSSNSELLSAPSTNLCSSGLASTVTGSGPWSWNCVGLNGGQSTTCSAVQLINGACGASNNADAAVAPTTNLCASGSASPIKGKKPFTWSCEGANGGTTASCETKTPVNGACGLYSGVTIKRAPSKNLCASGVATAVTGSGPWTWSCIGSDDGKTASCSASSVVDSLHTQ